MPSLKFTDRERQMPILTYLGTSQNTLIFVFEMLYKLLLNIKVEDGIKVRERRVSTLTGWETPLGFQFFIFLHETLMISK